MNNKKIGFVPIALVSIAITLSGIIWGSASGWGKITETQKSQARTMEKLEEAGCNPSKENTGEVIGLKRDIKYIREKVDENSIKQDANNKLLHEVMKEVRK